MKIKKLPQWLQDLATLRHKEYFETNKEDFPDDFVFSTEEDIDSCFLFSDTPEGQMFWGDICYGGIIPEQPIK